MSKIMSWCAGGLAVAGLLAAGGQLAGVRGTGSWGRAIEVPGLGALNKAREGGLVSVSCASAGSCAAGGYYSDRRRRHQGFVVSEKAGRWGKAIEVPGLGALNTGRDAGGLAGVSSVSCGSAGDCVAGGSYWDGHGHGQGFVAVERHGVWGKAIQVSGLGALNKAGDAGVSSVSCASAGDCAAGGYYAARRGYAQGFVVSEKAGRWGKAIEVPGLGALNTGRYPGGPAGVSSVSCGSAGDCAAGGSYRDRDDRGRGFVAVERHGVWGKAIQVPGLGALDKAGDAGVSSVSCVRAGYCAAGGSYGGRGFVVSENNGRWSKAIQVPGLSALGGSAGVGSVSCGSAGDCAAGGSYGSPYPWAFVVSQNNGVWHRAIRVPGLGALSNGRYAGVFSVSCGSPGRCAAGGNYEYQDGSVGSEGFVVSESDGTWGRAIEVPGLAALNKTGAAVDSVSCPPAGNCAAGGDYGDDPHNSQHDQEFVT